MATILSVEDIPENQLLMKRKLERAGHTVLTAENGVEAIAVARAEAIDLILMDLNMPVMDGFDATRILKSQAATQQIPVIAVSAYVNLQAEATAAGCDAFQGKPIDWAAFLDRISALIAARAGA
ncbi:MAG: response regulator [Deltaproteobacteria bacterium]|nr:response regulator [Deltaproteobacteria bacterium]